MRVAITALAVLLGAAALAAATTDSYLVETKMDVQGGKPMYEGRDIGDNIATPFVIPSLPFTESGNTCAYLDDYDETCPYPASTSPDVVYAFDCAADVVVNVSLCASLYDTKIYIYANVAGDLVCCNDDADCGVTGYQSFIENLFLYAGNTYYFVIDGYNGDCGDYTLEILPQEPCYVTAPAGALIEGEPECGPGYVDTYNGGCNSDPAVFQPVLPSAGVIRILGTSGTFDEFNRDTDWYELVVDQQTTITYSVTAEFPVLIFFLDGGLPLGCDDPGIVMSSATGSPCETVSLTETVDPGTYWLWVGPSVFSCQPCGLEYLIQIEGFYGQTPVEDGSWSSIKALYR